MSDQHSAVAVFITEDAEPDMNRHRSLAARFEKTVATLAERPDSGHLLTGDPLGGMYSLELTRQGGGFRAVYRWNQAEHYVVVFAVGPHKTVYAAAATRFPPPEPERQAPGPHRSPA